MSEFPNLTPPSIIVKRFHLARYYHHYHVILLAYGLLWMQDLFSHVDLEKGFNIYFGSANSTDCLLRLHCDSPVQFWKRIHT